MSHPTVGPLTAQIAQVVPTTEAEGPGTRFAVWFQGCPLRCPGCCNPEFLPFKGGTTRTVDDLCDMIARTAGIEGVTLLGGEPLAHAEAGAVLAASARSRGLSVMVFSGYTLDELRKRPEPTVRDLLDLTDILVDGPYRREEPDTERRWVGSRNQGVHFLTDRYRADDPRWRERNTLELRLDRGSITVNGFPAAGATGLWKGWRRAKRAVPADGANR